MKVPWRVLWSNDVTHILACDSPYHERGSLQLTEEMFRASIRETAGLGVDVHMIQPLLGWYACWRSEEFPIGEHVDWLRDQGRVVDPWAQYLADGGDFMGEMIDECRKDGLVPFVSFRTNDGHHGKLPPCRFYAEHPEYLLNAKGSSWLDRGHDWAIPEVREYKYRLYRDFCEREDIS